MLFVCAGHAREDTVMCGYEEGDEINVRQDIQYGIPLSIVSVFETLSGCDGKAKLVKIAFVNVRTYFLLCFADWRIYSVTEDGM